MPAPRTRASQGALAEVDRALAQGAIGVKVYKSLGMELRSARARYVLPDDPAFEPVFAGLEARGTTVYGHIAEPIAAWVPLDPKNPDYDYYRTNPAWHVHGRPGVPTKEAILAARDRLLERHPRLRFVGCHLGSMEEDVDAIAQRFDRYPGFAVDTAGRVVHLTLQPREKVRAFLLRYPDRVLLRDRSRLPARPGSGGDGECASSASTRGTGRTSRRARRSRSTEEGRGARAAGAVLRQVFRENALRWVPGLAAAAPFRP